MESQDTVCLRTVKCYKLYDGRTDPFLSFKIKETSSCAVLRKKDSEEGGTSRTAFMGEEEGEEGRHCSTCSPEV